MAILICNPIHVRVARQESHEVFETMSSLKYYTNNVENILRSTELPPDMLEHWMLAFQIAHLSDLILVLDDTLDRTKALTNLLRKCNDMDQQAGNNATNCKAT